MPKIEVGMKENWTTNAGLLGNVRLMPMAFEGHALYVRKCVTGEQYEDDFNERHIGGIILPQAVWSENFKRWIDVAGKSMWVEILAKGPNVGKPCSRKHATLHKRARWFGDFYRIGMLVMCPNMHPTGYRKSPFCSYEYFIEESVPFLCYNGEKDEKEGC